MSNNKFEEFYSSKSVSDLLEKLVNARITPTTMDKEWYEALVVHLNCRELSEEEKMQRDTILNTDIKSLQEGKKKVQNKRLEQEREGAAAKSNEYEPGKYTSLKTIVGLIAILGYVLIIAGTIILFYLISKEQTQVGFLALIICVVLALPLLAFSNLIYVFIDIERHTRWTADVIKEIRK